MELTSVRTIKDIAARFGFVFKKGLGQNFLTDSSVLDKIVSAANIENGVLEIGPGFGVLTYVLARTGKKVVTLEVDNRLIPVLDYTLAEFDNVTVVECDVLKTDVAKLIKENFGDSKISIAANLPYYITTPIITSLIKAQLPVDDMVFMVQREVAERICADNNSKNYGAISLFCQYYTEPEIVTIVPAGSFFPPPKVDSAVLHMKMRKEPRVSVSDEQLLFRMIKASFSQRRKTLVNGLASGLGLEKEKIATLLETAGFSRTIRGEKLSLEDFAKICEEVKKIL